MALVLCLLAFLSPAWSQDHQLNPSHTHEGPEPCSTTPYMEHIVEQYPETIERMQAIEEHTQAYLESLQHAENWRSSSSIINIPVVVHVVYENPDENLSEAQIISQIDVLNEDFRRLNADAVNTLAAFQPVAADTEIEFCLASVDPSGNPTNGINRVVTTNNSFSVLSDNVKSSSSGGADPWPSSDYLNIWVCDIGLLLFSEIIGYATFPGGPPALDGVVLDYKYFGRGGVATPPYDLGRATTHEVGHWLNLRHVWGNCSFFGCCGVDDLVADTPPSDAANYGCPLTTVSCGDQDMVQNYMDYSDDDCSNLFTLGQKDRARALFSPGGDREAMLSSAGCGALPNCATPSNLTTTINSSSSATLAWDPVPTATSYLLEGRQVGGGVGSFSLSTTSFTFNAFTPSSDYEWRVTADCSGVPSAASAIESFSTPALRTARSGHMALQPNPASQQVQVYLSDVQDGVWAVEAYDMLGRLQFRSEFSLDGNANNLAIDVANWTPGMYSIRAIGPDASEQVQLLQVGN